MADSANNNTLTVLPLDYTTIRNQLKQWLSTQDLLKDYNFDGSNLGVLLDLLSYNSFHNFFYTNMVASEMFLDSAVLRDSVVSHAKELNYVPRSNLSAVANVSLTFTTNSSVNIVTIPKYTTFTGRIGSNTYSFSTNTSIVAVGGDGVVTANNILLYEGILNNDNYIVDGAPETTQRFLMTNPSIDTSSLYVNSLENGGSQLVYYKRADDLFGLNANSAVYFLQAAENGTYELEFGDGVTGRPPGAGGILTSEYRISSGSIPNGVSIFTNDGPIDGWSGISIVCNQAASGGTFAEGVGSIKFNAPRHHARQERSVTEDDYESILQENFPEIIAVAAVSGDQLNPPQYGRVALTIALDGIQGLPDGKRDQYSQFLLQYGGLTVKPVFVDPEFLYWGISTTVSYNINVTPVDPSVIKTEVISAINSYNNVILNKFKANLRYSQLSRIIDISDNSIVGNETYIQLIKKFVPVSGPANYAISFGQPLSEAVSGNKSSINSSTFKSKGQTYTIQDDGDGNLFVHNNQTKGFNCGTVDYAQGNIKIQNLQIDSTTPIKIYAVANQLDVYSTGNVLLTLSPEDVTVRVDQIRE